ncbi:MAG: TonB-dependent receptor plug domain-containing protein, partial [Gemmatimonadetes bacterium]|nr:TonB-dependent receptor plug domain-containing protein [Gemmatimonadota bacterium]
MKPGPEYARRLISRAALQTGVTAARGCAGRAVLRAAAATILLLPAGAAAQAPADSVKAGDVIPMEELVVRVARSVATAGGVSAVVIRLDSLHTPAPAPLLEQSLRSTPLVHVRTNSRGEAELSLRGAESRQVAVLVDGVPLTLGWDHRTDVGLVPLTGAQSITLVRGLPSVLHGPNVLGGVVEVGLARAPLVAERPLPSSWRRAWTTWAADRWACWRPRRCAWGGASCWCAPAPATGSVRGRRFRPTRPRAAAAPACARTAISSMPMASWPCATGS